MGISLTNIVLILIVVLIIFGAGKLPKVMGDLGKGIKNFKEGLNEEEPKKKEAKKLAKTSKKKSSK